MPTPAVQMIAKARVERLATIVATIGAFEREEEAIISELEQGEGPIIARRAAMRGHRGSATAPDGPL